MAKKNVPAASTGKKDWRSQPRSPYRPRSATDPTNVVKYCRIQYGLSQAELAEQCGISQIDVSKAEHGHYGGAVWKYERLAEFFNISVDTLLRSDLAGAIAALSDLHHPVIRKAKVSHQRRQKRFSDIGELGEAIVTDLEKARLRGSPYAEGVTGLYAEYCHENFDLLSFTEFGLPVFIEIKSTSGKLSSPIYFSAGELAFMERCLKNDDLYLLYRLYEVEDRDHYQYRVYSGDELRDIYFKPCEYIAKLED